MKGLDLSQVWKGVGTYDYGWNPTRLVILHLKMIARPFQIPETRLDLKTKYLMSIGLESLHYYLLWIHFNTSTIFTKNESSKWVLSIKRMIYLQICYFSLLAVFCWPWKNVNANGGNANFRLSVVLSVFFILGCYSIAEVRWIKQEGPTAKTLHSLCWKCK